MNKVCLALGLCLFLFVESWLWLVPPCSREHQCTSLRAPTTVGQARVTLQLSVTARETLAGDEDGHPSTVLRTAESIKAQEGSSLPDHVGPGQQQRVVGASEGQAASSQQQQQQPSSRNPQDAASIVQQRQEQLREQPRLPEPPILPPPGAPAPSGARIAASTAAGSSPGGSNSSSPANLSAIASLLVRPARVYGRLAKAGVPAVFRRGLSLYQYRVNMRVEEWTPDLWAWKNAVKGYDTSRGISTTLPNAAAAARLRSPAPACFYFIDHKYKVIYARTTKTAGSSVTRMFGFIMNPATCLVNATKCMQDCMGTPMCMNRTVEVSQLEPYWQNYTVFGVTRNPWARAASSWSYANWRFLRNTSCVTSFARFAALPSAYPVRCLGEKDAAFLGALNHIEQQAECTFSAAGRPAVDFLARMEHLEDDLQDLVRLLNERRPPGTEELHRPEVPRSNINLTQAERLGVVARRAREYGQQYVNGTALADVRLYFDDDFRLMGFDHGLAD